MVNSDASIRALTYCELRLISREDVLHILKQYPLFKENFIKDLEVTYNLRGDDVQQVCIFIFALTSNVDKSGVASAFVR